MNGSFRALNLIVWRTALGRKQKTSRDWLLTYTHSNCSLQTRN